MAVIIPQVITEDRASGVSGITGSLTFDQARNQYLSRQPSVGGNRQKWTWSGWINKTATSAEQQAFWSASFGPGSSASSDDQIFYLWDNSTSGSYFRAQPAINNSAQTNALLRDNTGWYHLVCAADVTQASAADRMKIYINGELQVLDTNWSSAQNTDTAVNIVGPHGLGVSIHDADKHFDGQMSQVDFIDGRTLGPENFGFTDPLTGDWRPKRHKLTGPNDGTIWSDNCTASGVNSNTIIKKFFNGTTTSCAGLSVASGGSLVLTKDIPDVTSIGIYSNTGSSFTLTVNEGEGDEYTATVNSRNNVSILDSFTGFTGELHTLKLSGFGAGVCLNAIEINGVMLIDGDTHNIGANGYYLPMDGSGEAVGLDKSGITTPNYGAIWSEHWTASGNGFGSNPPRNIFDRDLTNNANNSAGGQIITWHTENFRLGGALRIYGYSSSGVYDVYVNGTKVADTPSSAGWIDCGTIADINELQFAGSTYNTTTGLGSAGIIINYIEIDGHILYDGVIGNSFIPQKMGTGSTEIATGAHSLLNTTGGGNVSRPGLNRTNYNKNYTVTVANPSNTGNKYYFDGALTPNPTIYRGATYTFDYTGHTTHPIYLSSLHDGKHNSKAYSVQFNGSNQYLTVSAESDYSLGTQAFTIECFVKLDTSTTNYSGIFGMHTGSTQFQFRLNAAGRLQFLQDFGGTRGNDSTDTSTEGPNLKDDKWHHVAVVRYPNYDWALYVDGQRTEKGTGMSGNVTNINEIAIGRRADNNSSYTTGSISNLRFTIGQSLYSGRFEPPTTTLTTTSQGAIASNVKLLCCQDSTVTTNNGTTGTITAENSANSNNAFNPFVYNIDGYYGVNSAGATNTKQTIPHLVPDNLYYFCNAHPGMGNESGSPMKVMTDVSKADPFNWKCVFATDVVTIRDYSEDLNTTQTRHALTNSGSTINNDFANFYGSSRDFDGSNDVINGPNSDDFKFGWEDFTVEAWVKTGQTGSYAPIVGRWTSAQATAAWDLRAATADNGNRVSFVLRDYGQNFSIVDSGDSITDGYWHHIAAVRRGSVISLFIDGVRSGKPTEYTRGLHDGGSTILKIGYNDSHYFDGQIQDVRIYKGAAKYTDDFMPAATNPDIVVDSPAAVAGKTNLTETTTGSTSISREDTSYLQAPASSDFRLDGEYCIEYFLNLYKFDADGPYVRTFVLDGPTGDGGSSNIHLNIVPDTGNVILWSGSSEQISGTLSIGNRGWHHVCVTRDGSNRTRLFVDGILSNWSDISTDYNLNSGENRPRLGALGGTGRTDGHFSNWRIIKGSIPTEYQTSTNTNGTKVFDPPTEPVTTTSQGATANDVKLIACQSKTQPASAVVSPNVSGVNDGTQWSAGAGPNFESVNPARDGFNGEANSNTRTAGGDVTAKVTLPVPVAFSSTLKVRGARDSGNGIIKITGGNGEIDVSSQFTSASASLETVTITGVTSPFKAISLTGNSSSQPRFSAIYIDDVMLVDPLVPNGGTTNTDAATGFNPFDSDINMVRGQEGAFAILNRNDPRNLMNGPSYTLSDGSLRAYMVGSNTNASGSRGWAASDLFIPSGKKTYCEMFIETRYNDDIALGIASDATKGYYIAVGSAKPGTYTLRSSGIIYTPKVQTSGNYGWVNGQTIGIAVDLESTQKTIKWYVDGILRETESIDESQGPFKYVAGIDPGSSVGTYTVHANFGQKSFRFPPPEGYQPLSGAAIRPDIVIPRSDVFFDTVLYTADQAGGKRMYTSSGMSPDFVWIKDRSAGENHYLADTVRGTSVNITGVSNKYLRSNTSDSEANSSPGTGGPTITFRDDGYELIDSDYTQGEMYFQNRDYASWCWKAGGSGVYNFNKNDVSYQNASDLDMAVGDLQSVSYNQTQNWTSQVEGTAVGSYPFSNMFNGDGQATHSYPANGSVAKFTPNPSFPNAKTVKIWYYGPTVNENTVRINGINVGDQLTNTSGTLTKTFDVNGFYSLEFSKGVNGDDFGMLRIDVDGVQLVDQGLSMPNVPSIANSGCSVGTKQGFSIVKFTGNGNAATIAHGLSEAPNLIIHKFATASSNWSIWSPVLGASKRCIFTNAAPGSTSSFQNVNRHTFDVASGHNDNNVEMIAYCWHDVPGLQKFGKYTGNGSAEGPYVELGFRPAMFMIKKIHNATGDWLLYDNKRNPRNPALSRLYPSGTNPEATANDHDIDFYATGFKIRDGNNGNMNNADNEYMYLAWADTASLGLYGAQANAR